MQDYPHIEVAASAGACFGVNRALDLVKDAAEQSRIPVHTLGPLIHNPRVITELDVLGVSVVDTPEASKGETLVLRTHGVTPDVEEAAHANCAHVIDATCPFVKRAHRAAQSFSAKGYQVLIVGEQGHAEALGTLGHAKDAIIISDSSELKQHKLSHKVALVVQTTMTQAILDQIVLELLPQVDELHIANTICDATAERQSAALDLAKRADVMLVLGGRISANTRHLADICAEVCPKTHHIENASELDESWFDARDLHLIGITAGASTPTSHIDELVDRLRNLLQGSC